MRLLNIKSKNFKTLQNLEIKFLSNYCTISGKNNAGKSSVIKALLNLFQSESSRPWQDENYSFDYKEDKTQWLKGQEPILISYEIEVSRQDDPAFITFLENQSKTQISEEQLVLIVEIEISSTNDILTKVKIGNTLLSAQSSSDVRKYLKSSNVLFHHNSTHQENTFYGPGRAKAFYEVQLSASEQAALNSAANVLEAKIKKVARDHRENLNKLLGRLVEQYDVEFSNLQKYSSKRHLFGIALNDKSVEVPLNDWGSGTQNRTYILISILNAKRIKDKNSAQDKITPIVIIEEPESFLHPSAQSEFGKILRDIANELEIQIIVTTHSPYMLNREDPTSNTLLGRVIKKKVHPETVVVPTDGENWPAPFSEHLGVPESELKTFKTLFGFKQNVLLVEGDVDKQYFEFLREKSLGKYVLDKSIEILPYGGYGALTNGLLLKFTLSNYNKYLITFDLDAKSKVLKSLEGIGLKEKDGYLPIGLSRGGCESIEGLLPERVLSAVHGRETELVTKLRASDENERKKAKDSLKKLFLEEFKKHEDYTEAELKEFSAVIKMINEKLVSQ